jgi:HK97 family phage major capsid protein
MPTALQDIVDKRASAFAKSEEFRARSAEDEDLSAEDQAAWKRALDEVDSLGLIISNQERDAKLDAEFGKIDEQTRAAAAAGGSPAPSVDEKDATYRKAFEGYMRSGMTGLTAADVELLTENFRALGTTSGSVGGYTVPEGFWAKVTETMKFYGGAIAGAEVITTSSGNPLPWPTNDDTANVGYILGENTAATNEGDLAFGGKSLGAYTFVSGPGLVSLQLLQDSGIDIESFVARKMGERLGRIQNTRFTTGTGSSQPQGYVYGATTGKTTASATAITYDEIIDLIHSVDAAYRASGRCAFKVHDLVLAYLRKLRDDSGGAGVGRPLWEPSVQAGQPDTLLGYPVIVNNDQDSAVTATKKTVAFGDFQSQFAVRKVSGGQVMRLTERYAEYLQVGFIAYERADSVVQDAGAAKLLVQHS